MGDAVEKLSGELGLDTTDFKAGIAAANRELRVLESGFKAGAASLGDWTKSADGLEMRMESLTKQIDIQKLKVAALRENYEKQVQTHGESSKAAQEAEIKFNKEAETLGKMEAELNQSEKSLNELSGAEKQAGKEADRTSNKMEGLKSVIGSIGGVVKGAIGVIAGLAAGVAVVTTAIGGLVFSTASASAELVDMSAKTGISTTRLQELAYVGDQVGTSQETITGSLARMIRTMSGAQTQFADYSAAQANAAAKGEDFDGQLGDNAAAFDRLGVQVTDSSGALRNSETVFAELITALGKIDNETERDALAMSIFGKSAMELNPLIKAGSDELSRLADEAHKVGAVMSEEDVAAFEAFDDTLVSLQAGLKGTVGTLMASFLPGFQSVFGQAGGYLEQFSAIVRGSNGDLGQVAQGLTGLIGQMIGDVTRQAPEMLQAGLGILQSIITAIVDNLPTMIPAAIGMVQTLLEFIIENLPVIISAGLEILIALVNGISSALPTLIPAITQAIVLIVQTLIENLPALIEAALMLIIALAEGLVAAVPVLAPAIPIIVKAIFDALIAISPMLLDAGLKFIETIVKGSLDNLPILLQSALDIGKAIVDGVWRGIQNSAAMFTANVKGFFAGIVKAVKDALGIHSPSSIGMDIGDNLVGSVGLGGEKAAVGVKRKLASAMTNLTQNMQANLVPGAMPFSTASVGAGRSISIGDIYVDARGAKDPAAVGQAVGDELVRRLRARGAL
jgi:hypothetical protein